MSLEDTYANEGRSKVLNCAEVRLRREKAVIEREGKEFLILEIKDSSSFVTKAGLDSIPAIP